jgi:flagellar basal-body rod protein FlgC
VEENRTPRQIYDPQHPDANAEGYVLMPDINTIEEMVNLITASRAYEANVTAMNITKTMAQRALEIGR